jgi:hypothetical protein
MASTPDTVEPELWNIDQTLAYLPGFTRGHLAQLRYEGRGPSFFKPTRRKVLYYADEVKAWAKSRHYNGTAEER